MTSVMRTNKKWLVFEQENVSSSSIFSIEKQKIYLSTMKEEVIEWLSHKQMKNVKSVLQKPSG